MTTWGDLEVGSRIIWSTDDFDGEYEVRVLKRGRLSGRAVLAPMTDRKAAKVGVRFDLRDEVELAEGSAAPDRPGSAVTSVLGATEVATVAVEGDDFACAPVDVTTVATHLRILHGIELQGLTYSSEDELLRIHRELHDAPYHEPRIRHVHRTKGESDA